MSEATAVEIMPLYQRATAEFKARDFKSCAHSYLEMVKLAPRVEDADIWLFNAAICARQARLLGLSVTLSRQLLQQYPRSRLANQTLLGLAEVYSGIGDFASAVQAYEDFGKRYPGHREGFAALTNVVRLRIALGEHARARKTIALMTKMYGRKRAREIARIALAAIPGFRAQGDDRGLIKYLRSYIKRVARADPDMHILALSELAQALWRRSCNATSPTDAPVGACLRREQQAAERARKRPTRCGSNGARTFWRPVKRNRKRADEAQSLFRKVVAMADRRGGSRSGQYSAQVGSAAAAARYHMAAPSFESGLQASFPRGLNFTDRAKKSQARMRDWLKTRERVHRDLEKNLTEVTRVGQIRWSVAAAERMAVLTRHFAEELGHAPIPPDVRRGKYGADKVEAFCSTLSQYTKPLSDMAILSYEHCQLAARRTNYHDVRVEVCQRALTDLRPDTYPATRELFGAPIRISTLGLAAGKDSAHWRAQIQAKADDLAAHLGLSAALLDEYRALAASPTGGSARAEKRARAEAEAALARVLALAPDDVRALVLYAQLYLHGGDPGHLGRARMLLDRAVHVDHRFAPAWNARGVVAIREREWARAAVMFERARGLSGSASDHEVTVNSGLWNLHAQAYIPAHKYLSAALKNRPDDYEAAVGVAVALRGLGRIDEARGAYERAIAARADRIEGYVGLAVLHKDFASPQTLSHDARRDALNKARELLERAAGLTGVAPADERVRAKLHREVKQALTQP